jgi:hypothetical protein
LRAYQGRTTDTGINETQLVGNLLTITSDAVAQCGDLTLNGACLGLLLGGDPSVEPDHLALAHD